jgi:hypothetical protein
MMKGAQTSSQQEDPFARVTNGRSVVPASACDTIERKWRRLMGSIVLAAMDCDEKRRAVNLLSSSSNFNFLEVDADYELDQPPAGIVSRRQILVGVCHTTKSGCREPTECVQVITRISDKEVDVVESVQEFASQLQVRSFAETHLLHDAQIRSEESWSFENEIGEATRS